MSPLKCSTDAADSQRRAAAADAYGRWYRELPVEDRERLRRQGFDRFYDSLDFAGVSLDEFSEEWVPKSLCPRDVWAPLIDAVEPVVDDKEESRQSAATQLHAVLVAAYASTCPAAHLCALAESTRFGAADGLDLGRYRAACPSRELRAARRAVANALGSDPMPELRAATARLLRYLLTAGAPRTELAGLLLAIGDYRAVGGIASQVARRHRLTRQAISKAVVVWRERLGLPPEIGRSKSAATREKFRAVALTRHWRRAADGVSVTAFREES